MSKVIQVLEKLASDAALVNENAMTTMLSDANINESQKQAILDKDIEQLSITISDFPQIRGIAPLSPAEEHEPETDEEESKTTDSELKTAASY